MAIETNAKPIIRIYKGETQVYENFENVWQPIVLQTYDKNYNPSLTLPVYFMEVDNRLIFKSDTISAPLIYFSQNETHPLLTLPDKYKNLTVISNRVTVGGQPFGFTAKNSVVYCYGGNQFDANTLNLSMLSIEFTK